VSFLIFLLCAAGAFQAYKRRSPLGFAGVAALMMIGIKYQSDFGLLDSISYFILPSFFQIVIVAAIAGGVSYAIFKRNGSLKTELFGRDDPSDMYLLVGRVLDTRTSSTVFSDTRVTQNAFGHLDTQTSHELVVTHNTWLHDLNNEVDVNYSGSGSLQARPGHILGTMSYKGRSLLDINFSTNQVFSVPPASTNILVSIVMATAMVLLGWVCFPLFALVSPLSWWGKFRMKGGEGLYVKAIVPGSNRIEAVFTYGGCIAYLLTIYAFSQFWQSGAQGSAYLTAIIVLFLSLVAMHQYVVRSVEPLHRALINKGRDELNRLYQEAERKHSARATAAAVAQPAVAPQAVPADI
jgi:hypothetical protein